MTESLLNIARLAMMTRGLEPDFSDAALNKLSGISEASVAGDESLTDLTHLPWCSIDNDDSLDLDQLSVSEPMTEGAVKILIAVADVDALVRRGSAIDR